MSLNNRKIELNSCCTHPIQPSNVDMHHVISGHVGGINNDKITTSSKNNCQDFWDELHQQTVEFSRMNTRSEEENVKSSKGPSIKKPSLEKDPAFVGNNVEYAESFVAIPEEFRPVKTAENLIQVNVHSKDTMAKPYIQNQKRTPTKHIPNSNLINKNCIDRKHGEEIKDFLAKNNPNKEINKSKNTFKTCEKANRPTLVFKNKKITNLHGYGYANIRNDDSGTILEHPLKDSSAKLDKGNGLCSSKFSKMAMESKVYTFESQENLTILNEDVMKTKSVRWSAKVTKRESNVKDGRISYHVVQEEKEVTEESNYNHNMRKNIHGINMKSTKFVWKDDYIPFLNDKSNCISSGKEKKTQVPFRKFDESKERFYDKKGNECLFSYHASKGKSEKTTNDYFSFNGFCSSNLYRDVNYLPIKQNSRAAKVPTEKHTVDSSTSGIFPKKNATQKEKQLKASKRYFISNSFPASTIPHQKDGFLTVITKTTEIDECCVKSNSKRSIRSTEKVMEEKLSLLIKYGRDLSDRIVNCYIAADSVLSFFSEWSDIRQTSICLFEEMELNISQFLKSKSNFDAVTNTIKCGADMAAVFPNPTVGVVGRLVSTITSFISLLFQNYKSKDYKINEQHVIHCVRQDIETTATIYIHGSQCNQIFKDVCKFVEEFHEVIVRGEFADVHETFVSDFVENLSDFNPKNHVVYFKRLQKCYEDLKSKDKTNSVYKAFNSVFEDWPNARSIIKLLHWSFYMEMDKMDSLEESWEQICSLIRCKNNFNPEDILPNIQNCIRILLREKTRMDQMMKELSVLK